MIIDQIYDIKIDSIINRGIPNQERIAISVDEKTNMGIYGLVLGIKGQGKFASPLKDNFFWFGEGNVYKGDWIFLYTGIGKNVTHNIPSSDSKLHTVFWGRDQTILNSSEITALILRCDGVDVFEENPQELDQIENKNK